MKPVVLVRSFALGGSRAQVWPLVADTDAFAAAMGMPAARFEEQVDPRGGVALTIQAGSSRYEESPYTWLEGRFHEVTRTFEGGLYALYRLRTELVDEPEGCRVTVTLHLTPRLAIFAPLLRLALPMVARRLERVYRRMDAFLRAQEGTPFVLPAKPVARRGQLHLEALGGELVARGHDPELVEQLLEHVATAPERDLTRLRPFALADAWGRPRRDLARLALDATLVGLLVARWEVRCPACRGAKTQAAHLQDLTGEVHCAACNVKQEASFDRSIELAFAPHATVRAIAAQEYCLGGPWRTPHVLAQALLDADRPWRCEVELAPGTYRLRSPQVTDPLMLTVMAGESDHRREIKVQVTPAGFHPGVVDLFGGELHLLVEAEAPVLVELERMDEDAPIMSAAYATTMPEFRTHFGSELLAPGVQLGLGRVTLLFTDLKDSTAMYEAAGDARAFGLVIEHFRVLEAAVTRHGGTVIKTIGDAVMAAFDAPQSCVAAAVEAQLAFARANATSPHPAGPVVVKMGMHAGPCLAVTLNEHLDYFGTTVNIAARVQGEARGHDLVVSEAVLEAPGVAEYLETVRMRTQEHFRVHLKGIASAIPLTRYVPDDRSVISP